MKQHLQSFGWPASPEVRVTEQGVQLVYSAQHLDVSGMTPHAAEVGQVTYELPNDHPLLDRMYELQKIFDKPGKEETYVLVEGV